MGLLGLSIELQQIIIEETLPDGFEGLALSCKRLYYSCEKYIEKHNRLKRNFWRFKYSSQNTGIISSFQLLLEISKEPLIARYLQHGDFSSETTPRDMQMAGGSIAEFKQQIEAKTGLYKILEGSSYIEDSEFDANEWSRILHEEFRPETDSLNASVILLTLLSHLKTMTPPTFWMAFPEVSPTADSNIHLWSILDNITRKANENPASEAGLSRLVKINPFATSGYDERAGLQTLAPFLAIKSVKELNACSCLAIDDGYTGKVFAPRYDTFGLNLESVELAACVIGPTEIGLFLQSTPRLKRLAFSYETKWHGCGHDWDAGEFTDAIDRSAPASLEELSLSVLCCYGDITSLACSFKGLAGLKRLEIGDELLVPSPFVSPSFTDSPPSVYKSPNPSIEELLPSSIEEFHLLSTGVYQGSKCMKTLFPDASREKDYEKLPNLSKVMVHYLGGSADVQSYRSLLDGFPESSRQVSPGRIESGKLATFFKHTYRSSA